MFSIIALNRHDAHVRSPPQKNTRQTILISDARDSIPQAQQHKDTPSPLIHTPRTQAPSHSHPQHNHALTSVSRRAHTGQPRGGREVSCGFSPQGTCGLCHTASGGTRRGQARRLPPPREQPQQYNERQKGTQHSINLCREPGNVLSVGVKRREVPIAAERVRGVAADLNVEGRA